MGYLSVPYRVLYEAKGERSGLTNVRAMVWKPDGNMQGPYVMSEAPSPLLGRYYFDYLSSLSDRPGEYFVMIVSPSEGLQTTLRVGLYSPPPGSVVQGVLDLAPVLGIVDQSVNLVGLVGETSVVAEFGASVIDGEINTTSGDLNGDLETVQLEGNINDDVL